MKSIGSYIGSFLMSVMLIFFLIGSLVMTLVKNYTDSDKIISVLNENNISEILINELDKHFTAKQNDTGIPKNVYMDIVNKEAIEEIIEIRLNIGFSALYYGEEEYIDTIAIAGPGGALADAISDFYSDYAESIGYEKDAKYYERLAEAQKDAKRTFLDYGDVFKMKELIDHGIIAKISPFYNKIPTLQLIVYGAAIFIVLLIMLINLTSISTTFYWVGACSVVSGLVCGVPCVYLKATDYFSAFTIKQPQIYTAYTGVMKAATDSLLTYSVVLALLGVIFIAIYGIISARAKKTK